MTDGHTQHPEPASERPAGWLRRLLRFGDPDIVIRRVRRNSLIIAAVLGGGVAVVTGSAWQVAGFAAAAALILLNFQAMVAVSDALVMGDRAGPSVLQAVFLAGRYVLLGLVLCGIVLLPQVGPIPVALGLSILVIAILLEAIAQVSSGAHRQS